MKKKYKVKPKKYQDGVPQITSQFNPTESLAKSYRQSALADQTFFSIAEGVKMYGDMSSSKDPKDGGALLGSTAKKGNQTSLGTGPTAGPATIPIEKNGTKKIKIRKSKKYSLKKCK